MTHICNPPLAYLVLINGDPKEWCEPISQPRQLIGRSRQCDIVVPERFQSVSRRHAELNGDQRGIRIRDLNSRSGTRVNGIWIEDRQEAPLMSGDRIWMGGVELEVVSELPAMNYGPDQADPSLEETARRQSGALPLRAELLLAELSAAELAIVLWIGRGYVKDEEIAEKLFRSPHTIRTQINSIFRKLNLHSRSDIIALLKGGPCESPTGLVESKRL